MAVRERLETPTTFTVHSTDVSHDGLEFELYAVGGGAFVASEHINGVSLRRSIMQNQVKVRPTNATAIAYLVTFHADSAAAEGERIASKVTEVILMQNGPKGGFVQTGIGFGAFDNNTGTIGAPGEVHLFVNEIVDAVITNA